MILLLTGVGDKSAIADIPDVQRRARASCKLNGGTRLLRDVQDGQVDIVVAESLDRLARDPEDMASVGKKLRFDRLQLLTISENRIDDVKFAIASMFGALPQPAAAKSSPRP
jgi:DNA invertase Pin-like site-specific DNA recombinase